DSLIVVRITGTGSILEDQAQIIEDAKVDLYVNRKYTEKLLHVNNGFYKSMSRSVPGSEYAIEVSVPGYPDVRAIDTLPIAVPILEGSMERGLTYDEYGDSHVDVKFSFQDQPGADFYEFMFLSSHTKRDDNSYN